MELKSWSRPLLGAYLLAFAIGSCSTAQPESTASEVAPPDLEVTMSDWRFAPENARIEPAVPVVLELRNTGEVIHEWALIDGHVEVEADLADVEILARLKVVAGGVDRLDVPALDPGVYEVVCPIPGHIARGMVGTLTVGS